MNFRGKKTLVALKTIEKKLPPIKQNSDGFDSKTQSRADQRESPSKYFNIAQSTTNVFGLAYSNYLNHCLDKFEARDQRMILPYLGRIISFSLRQNGRQFDQWLGQMYNAVASSSFKLYTDKQLNYEQMKVYISQNMLLNLLLFLEQINETEVYEVMKYLNKRLIDTLAFLRLKYPQAKDIKPNKKLREAFSVENNLENDQNDMLIPSGIKIEKKQSNDYYPQIMKVLNYFVAVVSDKCKYLGKQTTYYNAFSEVMEKIFQSVQFPQEMLSEDQLFQMLTNYSEQLKQEKQKQEREEREKQQKQKAKQKQTQQQKQNTGQMQIDQIKFARMQSLQHRDSLPYGDNQSVSSSGEENSHDDQLKSNTKQITNQQATKVADIFNSAKNIVKNNVAAISQKITKIEIQNKQMRRSTAFIEKQKNTKILNQKQLKQYREKVKKFTSFKIGQKINPNTELYSENQINQSGFEVKATAILRVITKWIAQLGDKIFKARDLILNRSFRFKTKTNTFIKLSSSEKNNLYQGAQKKIPGLKSYFSNIISQCMEIEGSLAKLCEVEEELANIPKYQYLLGKFCSRLESAASTYLVSYLNKIIGVLLQIPLQVQLDERQTATKSKDVNLITFKVSDLMRCKCSSRLSEVIRILSIIKKIGDEKQDLFKIVRIKDRLEMNTRDILINILFMNKILCQIQLAVNDEVEEKQKMFDSFGHYLYELQRSDLGPVMEASCIWTHLDQRSKLFKKFVPKISNQSKTSNTRKHICQAIEMEPFKYAFVCSLCGVFHSSPSSLISNKKCMNCKKHFECNKCIQQKINQKQLKDYLGLHSKQLQPFDSQFRLWDSSKNTELPNFAIFIPRKNKLVKYIFGQKITFKQKIYYVTTIQDQKNQVKAVNIFTMKGDTKHDIQIMTENYFVFEWLQKRYVNKTIQASKQIQQRQKQNMRRELEAEAKKKKMQEAKQKIRQRKKLQQKRWLGLMAVQQNQEDENSDEERQNKKPRKTSKQMEQGQNSDQKTKQKIFKVLIPNIIKSRPNSAASSKSRASKASRASSRKKQLHQDQEPNIFIQAVAKISMYNDFRVCQKKVDKANHILILGYYMSDSNIRSQIKQTLNKKYVSQLLLNKNQVLNLQQSAISENTMQIPQNLVLFKKGLTSVSEVYLDENKIVHLDFIAQFPKLRILHANHNYIVSIGCLQKLKNLTQIMLKNNQIYKIQGLNHKLKLTNLQLGRNKITKIQNLNNVPNLQTLSLYHNNIMVLQNLQKLTKLTELDLQKNQISNIEGLSALKSLQILNLSSNHINQIKNVEHLVQLKQLFLSRNEIPQIKSIFALNKLQILTLEKNKITKINGLSELVNLKQLIISKNQIKKIQNLEGLKNLQTLNLSQNNILKIDEQQLENLNNLQKLNLSYNWICDLNQDIITFLPKLKQASFINNPINKKNVKNRQAVERIRKKIKIFTSLLQ